MGIVCVYGDEWWPSMDLAAELLFLALQDHGAEFVPVLLRPRMPRLARRLGDEARLARNVDRFYGRYMAYPRWLEERAREEIDLFHVVDHSYAHLVHSLPADRTVVTCHDLDAFRSLIVPAQEPRPWWFRATMRRVLTGLRRAAAVTFDADVVREEAESRAILPPSTTAVTVPLPVHPDFSPRADPAGDEEARGFVGPREEGVPELLHVGSVAPRKRIDVLLRVFAAVRERHPAAVLVRAGGDFTGEQDALARELGVEDAIRHAPFVSRRVLASLYRRADVVLAPSEREGFGLPLVEAMACGTPVVASDLPVLREVGGEAVVYRPVGDAEAFADAVDTVLWDHRDARERAGRRQASLDRAAAFNLESYARQVTALYRGVLGPHRS